jgi:Ankyrin repeat
MVRVLVMLGAKVDAKDTMGCTPLHDTACEGCKEVTRALVELGAEVERKTKWDARHSMMKKGVGAWWLVNLPYFICYFLFIIYYCLLLFIHCLFIVYSLLVTHHLVALSLITVVASLN